MDRRLAAVMIADVVGYSRLSQLDEEGTRARFQASLSDNFKPRIAEHNGRLVKTMGDGVLVEFPSVINALRCAVAIQRATAEANADQPADRRLVFRIGINLGDVLVEGDDIHGNGVNIAERLQALAKPGGVVISGTAYDHVTDRLDVDYEFLGEQRVKNIKEPVRVYGVVAADAAGASARAPASRGRTPWRWAVAAIVVIAATGAVTWWQWVAPSVDPASTAASTGKTSVAATQTEKPSIVVLPFDNLSDDKDQGYLADGITEDLTTALARIPDLFVISRNAAFTYKDKATQPSVIAQELGVRYLLEGSIRRAGDEMRINAQLIDGQSSGHLWAERFDGAWSDVFELQDKVIEKVTNALRLRLVTGPRMAESPGGTKVPAAYDLYLQAYGLDFGLVPAEAASLLRQAVALDPEFGQAWADLGWVYWASIGVTASQSALGTDYSGAVAELRNSIKEAEKHPSASYYQLLADIYTSQRRSEEAVANAGQAIALNPSDPYSHEEMSYALVFSGRAADAKEYLDGALRVDPQWNSSRYKLAGLIAFALGNLEEAIASIEKTDPNEMSSNGRLDRAFLLTALHALLGHKDETAAARLELEKAASERGIEATVLRTVTTLPFTRGEDQERLWAGLAMAGLPDLPFGYEFKLNDRVSGEALAALVFGHELRGRRPKTGEPYSRTTSLDGKAKVIIGSSLNSAGISRVDSDFLCTQFDTDVDVTCAAIFRNPAGTPDKSNEYVWLTSGDGVEFSPAK